MRNHVALYDGYVSVGDEDVHVILGVEDDRVTMSSNGSQIGAWASEEISITDAGNGTYCIWAEDEMLTFVPNDQDLFAIEFGDVSDEPSGVLADTTEQEDSIEGTDRSGSEYEKAPPPKPITRVAFYALAGITAALGLWAIAAMLFG